MKIISRRCDRRRPRRPGCGHRSNHRPRRLAPPGAQDRSRTIVAAICLLLENDSPRYRDRTERNILEADATLICSHGPLTGGSALTEALATSAMTVPFYMSISSIHRLRRQPPGYSPLPSSMLPGLAPAVIPRIYHAVFTLLTSLHWPR